MSKASSFALTALLQVLPAALPAAEPPAPAYSPTSTNQAYPASDPSNAGGWILNQDQSELDVFGFMGAPTQARKKYLEKEYMFTMIDWSKRLSTNVWRGTHQLDWRVAAGFHVYGCEWNEHHLQFFADGELVGSVTKAEIDDHWVLKHSLWIWVDSETFPWDGLPQKQDLPVDFEIEYTRVGQRE